MPGESLGRAAAARHDRAVRRAEVALRDLDREGVEITFQAVARRAGVSRQWLYTQPALRQEIERLRDQAPSLTDGAPPASARPRPRCDSASRRFEPRTTGCGRRTPASGRSWRSPTASSAPLARQADSRRHRLLGGPGREDGLDPAGELVDRGGERGHRFQGAVFAPARDIRHRLAADVQADARRRDIRHIEIRDVGLAARVGEAAPALEPTGWRRCWRAWPRPTAGR
jgi:hypothetical protein